MVAGGDAGHPAWQQSWLNLVAKGLLSGGDDRLTITEKGRSELTPNVKVRGATPIGGASLSTAGLGGLDQTKP